MIKQNLKKIVVIGSLVFSFFVVAITAYYVNQSKEQAKKAGASQNVVIDFSPSQIITDLNTTINPTIDIDPNGNEVSAVELYLTYDKDMISIENVDILPAFGRVLKETVIDSVNGQVSLVLGIEPVVPVTSKTSFLSLFFKTKGTYGQTKITVAQNSRVAALNSDENALFSYGEMTVNINDPTATEAPTEMPTATSTAVATTQATDNGTQPTATATVNATVSPTDQATTAPTATPTQEPEVPNSCGGTCGSNFNCKANLFCYQGFCRNPICKTESDCDCSNVTLEATATSKSASVTTTKTVSPKSTNAVTSGGGLVTSQNISTIKPISSKPSFVYNPDDSMNTDKTSDTSKTSEGGIKNNILSNVVLLYGVAGLVVVIIIYFVIKSYKSKSQGPTIIPPSNL